MIIGLTGTIASGKSTVAEILKNKGFEHHTYSDILRLEAKKRGIYATRQNLQELGNQFKKESDNLGILSKLLIKNSTSKNIIADGIRTVDEIKELKKHKEAYVIAVDAPQEIRFERLEKRNREGDPKTFTDFKKLDDHENIGITQGQEIARCIENADFKIVNDSTEKELHKEIESILKKISQ
jgi:dephospho-CoA kinase